jgi:glutamate-ammonia-ligase adenylyltransferase
MPSSLAARAMPSIVSARRTPSELFTEWREDIAGFDELAALADHPPVRRLLVGLADHSPFLWQLIRSDPQRLHRILSGDPADDLDRCLREAEDTCKSANAERDVRRALRQARAHVALLVALADLAGLWSLDEVTQALTRAGETFVGAALEFLLRQAARVGRIVVDPADPQQASGLTILALGKFGAAELNYSSDIDLVVFYDPAFVALTENVEPSQFFVKLTQSLARLLSDRTEDGYVARVDLRLRPDPGSTPVAVSVAAGLSYYETLGQNWERAAYIKARPIAGARDIGRDLLRELEPFVWRRYFDYAAIADIHAMKRQIHAVKGFAEIVVAGHDVKLGRGGIREVEFFVQTQQLIFGGRRPQMRGRRTLDMLAELAAENWVTPEARDELSAAYIALRTVEHRLQMIADEQTQRLPSDPERLDAFAQFCGFATLPAFESWITAHFEAVERHYARLFEYAPGLDAGLGDLVFTGVEDDPATLATLQALGYADPHRVSETIRGWHFGRRPAVRTARAREVLTDLVPGLLQSFAKCGDPDLAVTAFDDALTRMPAATELFSMLKASERLRTLVGDILGAAPRLATIVAATPHVLDTIVDPTSAAWTFDDAHFAEEAARLARQPSMEDFLDQSRLTAREKQFLIGVHVLSGAMDPRDAGRAFSALAESLVRAALDCVHATFRVEHGVVPGARVAIVALGRLGSREMTATSDLDLMVVYDSVEATTLSDGRRPLAASQYFARLTQRLIAVLTAPAREGRLYDIDMRLRPWGTQGPLAVHFDAFARYQKEEAETWERMALCRARAVAGDDGLRADISTAVRHALAQSGPQAALAADIKDMRKTIAAAKGEEDPDNLKTLKGGLIDIEFIAQFLVLAHAADDPAIVETATDDVIRRAGAAKLIDADDRDVLIEAHRCYSDALQMQRLLLPASLAPAKAPPSVRRLIATGAGFPDAGALQDAIRQHTRRVREIFERVVSGD